MVCDGHDNCGDNSDEHYELCTPIETTSQNLLNETSSIHTITTTANEYSQTTKFYSEEQGLSRLLVIIIVAGGLALLSFGSILLLRFSCLRRFLFNENFKILPAPSSRRKVLYIPDEMEINEM